eukprot:2170349-Rhodomonas_salina.2
MPHHNNTIRIAINVILAPRHTCALHPTLETSSSSSSPSISARNESLKTELNSSATPRTALARSPGASSLNGISLQRHAGSKVTARTTPCSMLGYRSERPHTTIAGARTEMLARTSQMLKQSSGRPLCGTHSSFASMRSVSRKSARKSRMDRYSCAPKPPDKDNTQLHRPTRIPAKQEDSPTMFAMRSARLAWSCGGLSWLTRAGVAAWMERQKRVRSECSLPCSEWRGARCSDGTASARGC